MNGEELFVAAVAVVLGFAACAAAAGNWDGPYRLRKMQWIESAWGRQAARTVYALLGAGLIGLGIAIAAGYASDRAVAPPEESSSGNSPGASSHARGYPGPVLSAP